MRRNPIVFEGLDGLWSYRLQGHRQPKTGEWFFNNKTATIAWRCTNPVGSDYSIVVPLRKYEHRPSGEFYLAQDQSRSTMSAQKQEA